MDGGSWMLQAAAGDMHGGDTVSWGDVTGQEAMMLSSQAMQQQLCQIYMLMDMEEHDQYTITPDPSPSSSSFRSFSAATSRDDNSSLLLTGAATSTNTAASCHHLHQQPEVSSQIGVPPLSAYGFGVDVPNPEPICHQETTHPGQAARRTSRSGGHGATAAASAFRSYSRYLGPKRNLLRSGGTAGGGQRAFKKAISVLSKIHAARLAQYYQILEMAAAQARPSPATGSSGDNNQQLQLQHVMSERKRREKLNDSFKALRDVLPPATKKDKASILMRAKDYVNVLKARIAELEEKNRMLSESQLHPSDGDGNGEKDDGKPDDKIEVDIRRSAAVDGIPDKCKELHLKIVLGSSSGCSAMDAVAGILQGLNKKRDASLLATGNASSSGRLPRAKSSKQPAVRLQLKSSSCDEDILMESVIKVGKDVMPSETVRP